MFGLAVVAGAVGALLARSVTLLDAGNSVFGNAVAITGDAHQVQLAQDIFRAETRIELSQQIREDIRDVHQLMCETVYTQVTMGSIILGVCFTVFIEGYLDSDGAGVQRWVTEMWAMLIAWACMFTLTSLLLAMIFQTSIKHAARERLLLKHRIDTPNDVIIGNLGGYNLAEQVSRLHTRTVESLIFNLQDLFSSRTAKDTPDDLTEDATDGSPENPPIIQRVSSLPDMEALEVHADLDDDDEDRFDRQTSNFPRLVRANRGTKGWHNGSNLVHHKIADMPDFLTGGTLLRQRWHTQPGSNLRFKIRDETTMYVAGLVLPGHPADKNGASDNNTDKDETMPTSKVGKSTTWAKAMQLDRVCRGWSPDEMPKVKTGFHPAYKNFRHLQDESGNPAFQKVEGFSIYVDCHREQLPLYKLALEPPPPGEDVTVEIDWGFNEDVEALTVVLREGCVLTTEDQFPKQAFLNDLEVMEPYLIFADRYSRYGAVCIIAASTFMHAGRILHYRPWPQCRNELVLVIVAMALALGATMVRMFKKATEPLFITMNFDKPASAFQLPSGRVPSTEESTENTPDKKDKDEPSSASSRNVSGLHSSKASRLRFQTQKWLGGGAYLTLVLFIASVFWIALDAVFMLAEPADNHMTAVATTSRSGTWSDVVVQWPSLFVATRLTFSPDSSLLWVASDWLLMPMNCTSGPIHAAGKSQRLGSTATRGLSFFGQNLVNARVDGILDLLNFKATELGDAGFPGTVGKLGIASSLTSDVAPTLGSPLELPQGLDGVIASSSIQDVNGAGVVNGTPMNSSAQQFGTMAIAFSNAADSVHLLNMLRLQDGTSRLEVLTRVEPFAGTTGNVCALHLCIACAPNSIDSWLFAASDKGKLVAMSLSSGSVLELDPPWVTAGHQIGALAGNATHLVALVVVEVGLSPSLRSAPFATLLAGKVPSEL